MVIPKYALCVTQGYGKSCTFTKGAEFVTGEKFHAWALVTQDKRCKLHVNKILQDILTNDLSATVMARELSSGYSGTDLVVSSHHKRQTTLGLTIFTFYSNDLVLRWGITTYIIHIGDRVLYRDSLVPVTFTDNFYRCIFIVYIKNLLDLFYTRFILLLENLMIQGD